MSWLTRRRDSTAPGLHHIVVAGGSCSDWDAFGESEWTARLDALAEVARRSGARFVTVHPYEPDGPKSPSQALDRETRSVTGERHRRISQVGSGASSIRIAVDPSEDGRQRICDVLATWPADSDITEEALGRALFGEAGEPDLVVVLGPPNRLPRSLVWDLAYSELVFVSASWRELSADDVLRAVGEFAGRSRRFGGVDE